MGLLAEVVGRKVDHCIFGGGKSHFQSSYPLFESLVLLAEAGILALDVGVLLFEVRELGLEFP